MGDIPPPPERDRAIHRRVGHYMASVAELLLRDGYPVAYVGSCPPEELDDSPENDGAGYIDFAPVVITQTNGAPDGARELFFDWDTSSGWRLVLETSARASSLTRWMGAGLTPAPERVAAFFLSALLDLHSAGSDERPFYRQAGHDIDGLAQRLSQFDRNTSFKERFRSAQNRTAERQFTGAVLAEDTVITLPLRTGELTALQRLSDFLDMNAELRSMTTMLIADLKARAVATTDDTSRRSVTSHSTAAALAERLDRLRRHQG
ncbi:hypothetical protein [Streptomyces sp. NPDC048248]|uniref:hypothetical protein n=1 Tax=Streptomyces sp. NPDC048248 TaxID=3365523 RepID=UPI00371A044B